VKAPTPRKPVVAPKPAPRLPTVPRPSPVAVAPIPVAVPSPVPNSIVFYPILINVGGGEYTDLAGRLWSADQKFEGGTTFVKSVLIAGTEDDTIYSSERYGSFSYNFTIPVGNYGVSLKITLRPKANAYSVL
jgi:Malectin domain